MESEEIFRDNAFTIIDEMLELCNAPSAPIELVEEVSLLGMLFGTILFLDILHDPVIACFKYIMVFSYSYDSK